MKKISFIIILLISTFIKINADGIVFFEGTLQEAFNEAKKQNKKIFIDVYATWCGPCKKMAQNTFPDKNVGSYFNEKFVNYKINGEDPKVKDFIKAYEVGAYPTLLLLEQNGDEIASVAGAMEPKQLLNWAKTNMKDKLSYEQIYEKYKSDKKNEDIIRELLLGAPEFLASRQGSQRERWLIRIENLYSDYRKQKPMKDFMNNDDFKILAIYHSEPKKKDELVEYIVSNYNEVITKVEPNIVNQFIFTLNTLLIENLAIKGDMDYENFINRVKGDMKPIYDAMMKADNMDPYTSMKYLHDGIYKIYNRKDINGFITLTEEYLKALSNSATYNDYSSAVQTLYDALDGKLPPVAANKSIEWISQSLQFEDVGVGEKMELLIMLGDCYQMIKDKDNAKKCYNQAYVQSLQFNNPGLSQQIQMMINEIQ